jgi:crotonobetainyl-CoA:carnitine CoA-transferase CaiB-like acyl-CoA transferase
VGKVYDPEEMVADPQVQARDMVVEVKHPTFGTIKEFGIPIKLSGTPGTVRTAAPHAGEHTEAVLRELGMSAADIKALREKKIVG